MCRWRWRRGWRTVGNTHVRQEILEDPSPDRPDSVRKLRILDPACGSGHFLVIAFDLLAALYEEEARHSRDRPFDRKEIAESILEHNLFGVDIDPRAVQIAAAALLLEGEAVCAGRAAEADQPGGARPEPREAARERSGSGGAAQGSRGAGGDPRVAHQQACGQAGRRGSPGDASRGGTRQSRAPSRSTSRSTRR